MQTILLFALIAGVLLVTMLLFVRSRAMGLASSMRSAVGIGRTALDPVCKMNVKVASASTDIYNGTKYYFCSPHCHAVFLDAPDTYASSTSKKISGETRREHHGGCC